MLFLEQLLLPLLLLPGVNATGGIAAVGWAAEEETQTETKERESAATGAGLTSTQVGRVNKRKMSKQFEQCQPRHYYTEDCVCVCVCVWALSVPYYHYCC